MRIRHRFVIVASILSAVPAVFGQAKSQPVADPPAIQVGSVADTRARNFHSVPIASALGVELTLRVGYTDAIGIPSAYGNWRIDRANDDLGDNLIPPKPSTQKVPATTEELEKALENLHDEVGVNSAFTTLSPSYLKLLKDGGDKDFEVKLQLGSPKQAGKNIARLSGEFTIYTGGTPATVSVDKLTRHYGRPFDDPALKQAGVSIELLPPEDESKEDKKSDSTQPIVLARKGLRLRCKGNLHVFADQAFEVVDADGKSVKDGVSSDPEPEQTDDVAGIGMSRPLDDSMTLKINLVIGQKPVVVPFDLRDIPLP